jgi:alginate O-acetyltransferase complex protein AlgI
MLFNSIQFIIFFLIVTPVYFLLADRHRWKLLLAASCYFYMTFVPAYLLILGFTIVVDYFAGILIENSQGKKRKLYLILSICANLGVLVVFKYYNFLNENLSALLGTFSYQNHIPFLSILLPIGLSFHTFQAMSYSIEVYRGNQKPEKHFGIYALYVMFYPQLVAGPIERPQNMLPQFHQKHHYSYENLRAGLHLMLWGFFKKVVIADRLATYVDAVYNNSDKHSASSLLLASVFFSIQIYCDFSGYTDIARGTAKIMGYDLMINFRRPYFAQSIKEFWQRWHISLSTWFRDYIYKPMGGNRVPKILFYRNILLIFVLSGLWHGASWTFILWGVAHGSFYIVGMFLDGVKKRFSFLNINLGAFSTIYNISVTFILVSFARIFFRSTSIEQGFSIAKDILTWKQGELFLGPKSSMYYSIVVICILFMVEAYQEYYPDGKFSLFNNQFKLVRHATYAATVLAIFLFGVLNYSQFIYFQF